MHRLWNFAFDRHALEYALVSDKCEILGPPGMLNVREAADLTRLNRLAANLVRRLFEGAYRKQENRKSHYAIIPSHESGIPDQYYKEIEIMASEGCKWHAGGMGEIKQSV